MSNASWPARWPCEGLAQRGHLGGRVEDCSGPDLYDGSGFGGLRLCLRVTVSLFSFYADPHAAREVFQINSKSAAREGRDSWKYLDLGCFLEDCVEYGQAIDRVRDTMQAFQEGGQGVCDAASSYQKAASLCIIPGLNFLSSNLSFKVDSDWDRLWAHWSKIRL